MTETFDITDDSTGQMLTAAGAEKWLVKIITNPELAKRNWAMLGRIDFWLLVLTLMANPSMRDEAWNATGADGGPVLDEKLKFWLTVHSPENAGHAMELVRHVVHDLVSARYRMEVS